MDEKYPIIVPEEKQSDLPNIKLPDRKGHPRFYELLEEMADLHSRKNAHYTAGQEHFANIRESERFDIPAWKGCLIRMGDKWNRIISIAKGQKGLVDETTKDTLMDMAVYSLICIILLEENEKK